MPDNEIVITSSGSKTASLQLDLKPYIRAYQNYMDDLTSPEKKQAYIEDYYALSQRVMDLKGDPSLRSR